MKEYTNCINKSNILFENGVGHIIDVRIVDNPIKLEIGNNCPAIRDKKIEINYIDMFMNIDRKIRLDMDEIEINRIDDYTIEINDVNKLTN